MVKRTLKRIVAFICMVSLLMPCVVYATSTTLDSINQAKDKEKELEKKLEAVQETIDQLKKDMESTQKYMDALDEKANELADDIVEVNDKIEVKNQEIATTTTKLNEAIETENMQYESMKSRIKYMYESGNQSYFDILLNSSDFSDMLNRAEYVSKITEYDREKLNEYIAIKESIEEAKLTLEQQERELQEYKEELEGNLKEVDLLMEAKNQEMEALKADSAAYKKKQAELEKDKEELDKTITRLTQQYSAEQLAKANAVATQGSLYSKQLLVWPCPSSTRITSHFSMNRLDPVTGSYYAAHKGTDVGAPTGTPVVAAATGLVTAAGYSNSMGNYIVISHGDGITTRYYHNSRLAVSAGQAVTAGQVISYVGSTGWSTGPHLHFEVRINDTPVDPMQFF